MGKPRQMEIRRNVTILKNDRHTQKIEIHGISGHTPVTNHGTEATNRTGMRH